MSTLRNPSRRVVLQRAALAVALGLGGSGVTSGCAGGGRSNSGGGGGGEKSAENPFGVKPSDPLDVVIFRGGYGDDYAKFHQQLYRTRFGAADVKHSGITDISAQLQPRFNGGNPPDVVDNSGAMAMPMSTLAATGQLSDLTDLFDAPSIDDPATKVRDAVAPIGLEAADLAGKPLVLNYVLTLYATWYDKTLFDQRGWTPARNWPEFLDLCAEIKKSGIAPLAHQGKYPMYIGWFLLDLAVKHGGVDVIKAIDSLEPNAWKHPSIKLAAEALLELKGKGYLLQGTEGLDHIRSQTAWSKRRAAFIPCGSWLENEQKPVAPADFKATATFTPALDGSKLPVESVQISASEGFIVPERARNRVGGLEYLRLMLSKEGAARFTQLTGSQTIVPGAADGLDLSPGASSAAALVRSGGDNNWTAYFSGWYSTMEKPLADRIGELAAGRSSADEFCAGAQKVADGVAGDPKAKKRTRR
jgi:N-acetylglucosamine transport system substrate-binding protein